MIALDIAHEPMVPEPVPEPMLMLPYAPSAEWPDGIALSPRCQNHSHKVATCSDEADGEAVPDVTSIGCQWKHHNT